MKYKIIGRTVHLYVIYRDVYMYSTEPEGFRIILPSFLRPLTGDGVTPLGSPALTVAFKQQFGTGIWSSGSPNYDKVLRCDLHKAVAPSSAGNLADPILGNWHLFIRNAYRGSDAFAYLNTGDPLYQLPPSSYLGLGQWMTKLSKYFYGSSRTGGADMGTISLYITYDLD